MSIPEPGWYPDAERFGCQRYWDGTTWTSQVRLGFGSQASGHPGIEPMSACWCLVVGLFALEALILVALGVAILLGSQQVLGLALVALSPLLWICAAALLLLLARTERHDQVVIDFVRRSRVVAAGTSASPIMVFFVGWAAIR